MESLFTFFVFVAEILTGFLTTNQSGFLTPWPVSMVLLMMLACGPFLMWPWIAQPLDIC